MKYKFASFNFCNLSEGVVSKRDFETVYDIIEKEKIDVIAFQEILSEGKAIKNNISERTQLKAGSFLMR